MHEIATVSSLLTSCDFYVPEDSFTKSEAEYLLQEIEQLYMLAFEPYRGLGPGGGPRFSYGTPKERRKGTVAALHVNKRNRPPSGWLLVRCGGLFGAAIAAIGSLAHVVRLHAFGTVTLCRPVCGSLGSHRLPLDTPD